MWKRSVKADISHLGFADGERQQETVCKSKNKLGGIIAKAQVNGGQIDRHQPSAGGNSQKL